MNYSLLEWTDEKVQRFWNYESQFPEHYFTFQVGGNLAKLIKRYTRKNDTLLDYGSGPGFLIKHLLDTNFEVYALDFSHDTLKKIKEKYEGKTGFAGAFTIEELGQKSIKFDIITLIEVIEHLNDQYLELTFKNIHHLLKPGGYLIITTPNDEDLSKSFICCPQTNELFHRWQHIRSWNTDSLKFFLKESGFIIHKIKETNFNYQLLSEIIRFPIYFFKLLFIKESLKKERPHLYCICSPDII